MGNRIVVIGSNSFSGASLIRQALEQGDEILGISRSPENKACLLPYKEPHGIIELKTPLSDFTTIVNYCRTKGGRSTNFSGA